MPSAKARIGTTTPARAGAGQRGDVSVRAESGNIAARMLPTVESKASVAVIGAGSWGTTVAAIMCEHATTTLWGRNPELIDAIARRHENPHYLAGVELPDALQATTRLDAACAGADVVVMAVPSHGYRAVLELAAPHLAADVPVVSLAKGIERGTLLRMTEVTLDVLTGHDPGRVAVLTGPNLAREVAEGQPAASVIACRDEDTARELQQLCMSRSFRVYTNPDVVGCEIAGAMKNVIAIAAGTAAGLGYGDNTQAALITRGLAEVARLGVALGGEPMTFAGLAGLGDLVATCTSPKSRNRSVGFELGRGRSLDDIVEQSNMVAEGVRSTAALLELAARGRDRDADRVDGGCGALRRPPPGRAGARAHAPRGEGRAPRSLVTGAGSDPLDRGTLIGVLGGVRDATVDRTGVLAPRATGWELDWWIGADDRWHVPGREAAVRQTLVDGMPVVQTSMRVPGGDAVHRVYGAPVADVGEVAVAEIANESPAPFVAALVVRGASAVDLGDATAFVDGRSAVRTPRPPSRWALAADGSTEELVTSGAASDAPFAARRDRGARLVAAFLYPVAHRTTLRAVVAIGTRGLGTTEPAALPDAAAVARGWTAQLDRGMRVELPDEALQRAVGTARAATVLAGQAWKVAPEVVAVLEDWGLDPEAATGWARLTGRERRRLGRRTPPATGAGWAEVRARAADPTPALLEAVRAVVVRETDDGVEVLGDWPPDWIGQPIDVLVAPTRRGPVSYSVRWHGDRPALLWEVPDGVRVTAPGLDPAWSTSEPRGRRSSRPRRGARDR